MPLVKLFESNVEDVGRGRNALSLMQTAMDVFMLGLNVDVRQVNGPYVSYLPPEREGSSQRVVYTANIVYHNREKA